MIHYGPKRLVIAARFHFYKPDQKLDETVAQYAVELQTLASPCKVGPFLDEALRDRLVCGIRSDCTRKHLLTGLKPLKLPQKTCKTSKPAVPVEMLLFN